MTLDEYIDKSKEELETLRKHYKEMSELDPENWPFEMPEGEWNQQELDYRFYRRKNESNFKVFYI